MEKKQNRKFEGALKFVKHEAFAPAILLAAAFLALLLQNSALSWLYDALMHTPVTVGIGALMIDKPSAG